MGGADGAQPGRVIEYDARLNRAGSWPSNPPADGFNPHGISIDEKKNLMVTSDFVCPLMTLHLHGAGTGSLHLRGTVRVWDLANRTILRTVDVNPGQPSGTMDVALIPHDSRQRAFTAGMIDNKLYLIDTQEGTSTLAYDFNTPLFKVGGVGVIMPQLMRVNKNGTRLFVTVNYGGAAGKVAMFDIARPDRPKLMDVVDLGPGSGPHSLRLTRDEDRLVVTDYFLVEDLGPGGVVKVEGDHKVHVINVHGNRLELDRSFDLDMNRDVSTGRARPHGVIMLPSGK
jgi:selenium-binding protein 1